MRGFITEVHFRTAEGQFPGIRRFYEGLEDKPMTFLELMWQYTRMIDQASASAASSSPCTFSSQSA